MAQRHPIALLALLTLARDHILSRDKLLAYLWPDINSHRARHRFNGAVHKVRRAFGEDAIESLVDDLRLNPKVVSSDVSQFEAAVRAGDLERVVQIYGGPFLDGFHLKQAKEFDEWASTQRQRLADRYATALRQLAEEATERGDTAFAIPWWQSLKAVIHQSSKESCRRSVTYLRAPAAADHFAPSVPTAQVR